MKFLGTSQKGTQPCKYGQHFQYSRTFLVFCLMYFLNIRLIRNSSLQTKLSPIANQALAMQLVTKLSVSEMSSYFEHEGLKCGALAYE